MRDMIIATVALLLAALCIAGNVYIGRKVADLDAEICRLEKLSVGRQ